MRQWLNMVAMMMLLASCFVHATRAEGAKSQHPM